MVLTTVGIGAVVPILVAVTEADLATKYPAAGPFLETIGSPGQVELLVYSLGFFLSIIFLKSLMTLFIEWKKISFTSEVSFSIRTELFGSALCLPYELHAEKTSATLIRNVTSDVNGHNRCLKASLTILAESLVVIALMTLLLWVDALGTLLLIALSAVSGFFFHKFINPKIARWGSDQRKEVALMLQHAQQGFGGVKEIKASNSEDLFIERFRRHAFKEINLEKKFIVATAAPAIWFELLTALGVVVLVMSVVGQSNDLQHIVPVLGIFVASAVRIMPSFARIVGANQVIRYNRAALGNLMAELKAKRNLRGVTQDSECDTVDRHWKVLRLTNVDFKYPGRSTNALSGIDLEIRRSTTVGIIGESGSGKTTLVDLLLGLLTCQSGEITVDDLDLAKVGRSWREQVGLVPQSVYITDDTIANNVLFGVHPQEIDREALIGAIRSAKLETLVSSLEKGVDTRVGERGASLSGGQQQRIGISRALYRDPSVLILDEATSSLDYDTEKEIMSAVEGFYGKKTIIIIAHRWSTVRRCDYLYELKDGRIYRQGSYDELISSRENSSI